jgi:tetratricopeptide (TPR) repeat protein
VGELESLRIFFRQSESSFATTKVRLRIVAFSSEWEFDEFRTNAYSPAYFAGGPDQPTIVLGRLAKETLPALRHEYVHYALSGAGNHLPLWLEEGLAEYYGGVSAERAARRSRLLAGSGWIPLGELLAADRNSEWYRQPKLAERYYAECWALVDWLMRQAGPDAPRHLGHWAAGIPEHSNDLEAALRRHATNLRGSTGFTGGTGAVETRPAGEAELDLALARVALNSGNLSSAQAWLDHAAGALPEALAVRGEIELKQGRRDEARQTLREAMRRNGADKRALWHLAVLEQTSADGDAVPVLERLVESDPGFDEARLVLSSHYLRLERYPEALSQLRSVRSTPPDKADFFQRALALAESRAGSTASAASFSSLE